MMDLPDRFEGIQATTSQGSGRGHRSPHGFLPKAGCVEAPRALVQASVRGEIPTTTRTYGQHSDLAGRALQVQSP